MKTDGMTIAQILEKAAEEICSKYCKWPDAYNKNGNDNDDEFDRLLCEKCEYCPVHQLMEQ